MNDVTTVTAASSQVQSLALRDDELMAVLQNSLYPGAKPESIKAVLAFCRAAGKDPLKKPYHIVPMYVKPAGGGQGGMRDVIMPGINDYRIDASRTGQHAGTSEPEFGPDLTVTLGGLEITVPTWCKVTVKRRMPDGEIVEFTAKEFWRENYATAGRDTDKPNAMWAKRPYGQLAKCAEAQALRKGFPEVGSQPTAEEMEGKTIDGEFAVVEGEAAPKRGANRPKALPRQGEQQGGEKIEDAQIVDEPGEQQGQQQNADPASPGLLNLLETRAEQRGYTIAYVCKRFNALSKDKLTAADAQQAVTWLKSLPPALVLLGEEAQKNGVSADSVCQRFNVQRVEDLTPENIMDALEWVGAAKGCT